MSSIARAKPSGPVLVLVLVSVSALLPACTKHDALVLLDLRTSGPLVAPVARVRMSAPGWDTRVVTASLDSEGLRLGYYGPADGGAVSVTVEALDGRDCVLGKGSGTVLMLASGGTSDPLTLFVRPLPDSGCKVVGGTDDAGADGGGTDDASTDDAGADATMDAGDDATD